MSMSKKNQKRYAVGLMSGTSLDGVDAVLVEIEGAGIETKLDVIDFISLPMEPHLREQIRQVSDPKTSRVDLICSLNVALGRLYSETVTALLEQAGFKERLDFIASHGQTIYHLPRAEAPLVNSTLQIGDPSQLAFDHKTDVIFNFRMMDMVAGGDGAPLVPYTEYILYRSKAENILLQNIGGIGNVTILPKNCTLDEVTAFDTGPGNMMINSATDFYYQKPFDYNGTYAEKGKLILELFNELKSHPYLAIKPPKSTGREAFGENIVQEICSRFPNRANDVIYTLTHFTAYTIAESYRAFILPTLPIDRVIIGGGGAYNPTLMAMLRSELPDIEIVTQEDLGHSSNAKEAIAFAILGNETLHGIPSNAPSATGSKARVILGQISPNPWS